MISTCPVCDEDLDRDLNITFVLSDYPVDFEYECPECGAELEVEVIAVPEFDVTKRKETRGFGE